MEACQIQISVLDIAKEDNYPFFDPDGLFDFCREITEHQLICCLIENLEINFPKWYCPSLDRNYIIALFGSAITSISLGFRSCLPSKLAAEWFSQRERDTVNSLASLADPLGTMLAYLIVPFIVKEPTDLWNFQVYIVVPLLLTFIGSLFINQEGYNFEVRDHSSKEKVAISWKDNYYICQEFRTIPSNYIHWIAPHHREPVLFRAGKMSPSHTF